jgi:site-specific DNA-methyltransferase (adenine-specific)
MLPVNELYCGDNLEILREYIAPESVDLVYLDPPFNSDQNYNLLFREKDGSKSNSQIMAFEDTWEWNLEAEKTYQDIIEKGGKLGEVMTLFRKLFDGSDMLAYLSMMAPRLEELRRVLKPTGSLYLHCDPTASHYLKMLMDAVFGPEQFRNEIIWKRKSGRGETNNEAIRFGVTADSLLFYVKSSQAKFYRQIRANNPHYIQSKFTNVDSDGRRYHLDNISSPSYRPNLCYEYKGHSPPPKGWAVSRQTMEQMDRNGRLYVPADLTKRIRRKRFLDELQGETVDTLWDDIPPVNSQAKERIGYPTQKPQALLERIINASSAEGDVVLDPFCGCGTAIEAAHAQRRQWIGIDLTKLAIDVVKKRLAKIGEESGKTYRTIWEPRDVSSAKALAAEDPFQFQDWIVKKLGGISTRHRGADRGIDGRLYFKDHPTGPLRQIIVSVKSGKITPAFVRELHGTVNREKAAMGILATLATPTKAMGRDATTCGFHKCLSGTYPRMQIITVDQIFAGTYSANLPPIQRVAPGQRRPSSVAAVQISLPGIAN